MALRMVRAQDAPGMVTAELAVTTLAAFALLATMCWGIYLVVTQLRCVDAAAAIARQAARADTIAVAKAKAAAPAGATIAIDERPSLVIVTVRVRAQPLGRWLVAVPLEARAQVVPEPAAGEDS
ncbi:MAG TPA: TadE family type IV pilus minor pilin [Propionibacteriaceae bacterium]|nr:TadE family type IV pilus minor pilin [Propionibacteriaceae bacterium]